MLLVCEYLVDLALSRLLTVRYSIFRLYFVSLIIRFILNWIILLGRITRLGYTVTLIAGG